MRLAFMGTPDFAAVALRALIAAGHQIACVYTQPPRPAHRGKQPTKSAVHQLADAQGLEVRTPLRLRDAADQQAFADLQLDVAVVAAYGLILPQAILDAPKYGCLNIHASLLPRWRGAAPIHRAVMAGDTQTGICIMQMDAGLDTGPVLLRQAVPIVADDTTGSLHETLAALGGRLCVDALAQLGSLQPEVQSLEGITYAHKIDKHEARLDFSKPAAVLERTVRALSPAPGAYIELDGERIKILRAAIVPSPSGQGLGWGTILNAYFTIVCGQNTALQPTMVQRAGKQPVAIEDFLRGFAVPAGARLP
jgi:methionyl-tRNA formyltransferase